MQQTRRPYEHEAEGDGTDGEMGRNTLILKMVASAECNF